MPENTVNTIDIVKEVMGSEDSSPNITNDAEMSDYAFDFGLEDNVSHETETKETEEESNDSNDYEDDFTMALEDYLNPVQDDQILDYSISEDDYELPVLDPELAENPILLKRAKEYEAGVKKLVSRLKEKEESFANQDESVQTLMQWNEVLSNPETVKPGLAYLVKGLCEQNGIDIYDLMFDITSGSQQETTTYTSDIDKLVEQKLAERLKDYQEDLEYVKSTRTKKVEEEKFTEYINKICDSTRNRIKQADNGWLVSREMVENAVKAFPKMSPEQAVKALYSDERIDHYKKLNRGNKQAPTLAPATKTGYTLPDSENIKAIDIMRMMSQQ